MFANVISEIVLETAEILTASLCKWNVDPFGRSGRGRERGIVTFFFFFNFHVGYSKFSNTLKGV